MASLALGRLPHRPLPDFSSWTGLSACTLNLANGGKDIFPVCFARLVATLHHLGDDGFAFANGPVAMRSQHAFGGKPQIFVPSHGFTSNQGALTAGIMPDRE